MDLDGGRALTSAPSVDVRECMRWAFEEANRSRHGEGAGGSGFSGGVGSGGSAGVGDGDSDGGSFSGVGDESDPCRSLPPQCCNTYGAMPLALSLSLSDPPAPGPTSTTPTTTSASEATTTTTATAAGAGTVRPLLHYTEQLVLFSSLGHYLDNPLLLYDPDPSLDPPHAPPPPPPPPPSSEGDSEGTGNAPSSFQDPPSLDPSPHFPEFSYASEPFFDPLQFAYNSSCAALNAFFERIHVSHTLRAEDLGHCWTTPTTHPHPHNDNTPPPQPQYLPHKAHLYGCLQMPKKMHPSFDAVLLGVLINDPSGGTHPLIPSSLPPIIPLPPLTPSTPPLTPPLHFLSKHPFSHLQHSLSPSLNTLPLPHPFPFLHIIHALPLSNVCNCRLLGVLIT